MGVQHKNLAAGGWHTLTLSEQLGNVGSEVSRAIGWHTKDDVSYGNAIDRARELLDLTIGDSRWRGRLKELARVREFFCDAVEGGTTYGVSLLDLERYFFYFAIAARLNR